MIKQSDEQTILEIKRSQENEDRKTLRDRKILKKIKEGNLPIMMTPFAPHF